MTSLDRTQSAQVLPDRVPRSLPESDQDRPWHAPGVYAVAPGVFRVPLPLPDEELHSVNVYVLDDSDGLTLIDSGQATLLSRKHLAQALDVIGHRFHDVRRVLVTHIHRNHYTHAVALRREFGTHIRLGRGEERSLRLVAEPSRHTVQTQLAMLRECGAESIAAQNADLDDGLPADLWEEPDAWLDHESVRLAGRTLETIATPVTPAATWSSVTRPPACCSQETTCSRTSRPLLGSNRLRRHYPSPTTSAHFTSCGRFLSQGTVRSTV